MMTPSAVELALDIRREIEARQEEADRLRCRAVERAQVEADLAQRRFMMVDPSNRLVADTLEADWNEKLRALAKAREERERARQRGSGTSSTMRSANGFVTLTTDFKQLWADPATSNRERKRMLAHIIEDATLIKLTEEGTTKIHVRFKGRQDRDADDAESQILRAAGQNATKDRGTRRRTPRKPRLLGNRRHTQRARASSGRISATGARGDRFTAKRVAYLMHTYGLRSRYDRLRERGMLNRKEMAERLGHSRANG